VAAAVGASSAAGSASAKQRQRKNPSFLERSKLSDATIDTLQTELPQSIERQMDEFMSNMAQEAVGARGRIFNSWGCTLA